MGKLSGAEKKVVPVVYALVPKEQEGFKVFPRKHWGSGKNAGMAELVDARDLGSRALCVRVRVSLPVSICIIFRGV